MQHSVYLSFVNLPRSPFSHRCFASSTSPRNVVSESGSTRLCASTQCTSGTSSILSDEYVCEHVDRAGQGAANQTNPRSSDGKHTQRKRGFVLI